MFGGEKEYIAARPGEAWETLADTSTIHKETGWIANINLEQYVNDWKLQCKTTQKSL